MKRISLFVISLILVANALAANLTSTELEDVFGSVRAELVRQICDISEISDTSVINSIDNRNLQPFKKEFRKLYKTEKCRIRKKELSQIKAIIKNLPASTGEDFYDCVSISNTAIANSISSLYKNYPNRNEEILSAQTRLNNFLFYIIRESNKEITKDNRAESIIENAFASLNQLTQDNDENSTASDHSQNQHIDNISPSSAKGGCIKTLKRLFICLEFLILAAIGIWLYFKDKSKQNDKQTQQAQSHDVQLPIEQTQESNSTTQQQMNQGSDATKIRVAFAKQSKEICVVGASVIGLSHIQMKKPCQDFCGYESLENGWGIAITSDGAGSAEHSEVGSRIVVERGIFHFKQKILTKNWIADNTLPTDAEWTQVAYYAFKSVYDDLKTAAEKKGMNLSSLAATAIVLIHTPKGILVSHIGDGRAGYTNRNGCWQSIIVPHKGEEANQTIFITSDFWNIPNHVMSGVIVPESRVIRDTASAFTLMSDGCESACWLCNRFNDKKQMYCDPNEPYDKFFTPICNSIESMKNEQGDSDEMGKKWANYLLSEGKFAKEPDDKTMIVGTLLY